MFLVSLPHTWPVQFSRTTERLAKFRWCIAKGRHLFPFRTEQLSLSAPMVLGGQPPGRVGRRRFFIEQTNSEPPAMAALRRSGGVFGPQGVGSGPRSRRPVSRGESHDFATSTVPQAISSFRCSYLHN